MILTLKKTFALKLAPTLWLFIILFLSSCQYFKKEEDNRKKQPIARVGINYFYQSDLESSLPETLRGQDSIAIAESVVEDWVTQKLMEEKALDFLPQKTIERVERKVANYRSTLYAFQYEQELLSQKLNPNISNEELEQYYLENPEMSSIAEPIVLIRYFVLKQDCPVKDDIKDWLLEKNDLDENQIKDWAKEHSNKYNIDAKWLDLNQLRQIFSNKLERSEILQIDKLYEKEVGQLVHLALVEDFQTKGNFPDGYQSNKMKQVLLNQKKEDYLKEIKNKLLNEGYDKKLVERY